MKRSGLPPVADDVAADSLAYPSPMVELTAKFHRMGSVNKQEHQIVTPEYHEPPSEVSQHPYYHIEEDQVPHQAFPQEIPNRKEPLTDDNNDINYYEHFEAMNLHERIYRGPKPTIPDFTKEDPREFARLKIALENLLPHDATERFKYQILLDHLKFEDALLIADSYTSSKTPYSDTMASLTRHYGKPHQLALQRIAELMDGPNIQSRDTKGFKRFALQV